MGFIVACMYFSSLRMRALLGCMHVDIHVMCVRELTVYKLFALDEYEKCCKRRRRLMRTRTLLQAEGSQDEADHVRVLVLIMLLPLQALRQAAFTTSTYEPACRAVEVRVARVQHVNATAYVRECGPRCSGPCKHC
eukprot:2534292-Pleurochrysis_carterae.AAC.1